MNATALPLPSDAQAILSILKSDRQALWVFDGEPGEPAWIAPIFANLMVQAKSTGLVAEAELLALPVGAPVGSYAQTSYRLARATGLVMEETAGGPCLKGTAVAQGELKAGWTPCVDGLFLTVEAHFPRSVSTGAAANALCEEQLMVRCLRQFELQAVSLLESVEGLEHAQALDVSFVGDWDESTELLRRKFTKVCLQTWAAHRSTGLSLAA